MEYAIYGTVTWSDNMRDYIEFLQSRGKRMKEAREISRTQIIRLAGLVDQSTAPERARLKAANGARGIGPTWSYCVEMFIKTIEANGFSKAARDSQEEAITALMQLAEIGDKLYAEQKKREAAETAPSLSETTES